MWIKQYFNNTVNNCCSAALSCSTLCHPVDHSCQAALPFTISRSLLKLMSIESWYHPTISSSVIPFSCPQSFKTSVSLPVSQLFASGGQRFGVSSSASVLLMNIQSWFRLGWPGGICLQSKGLSRVFSNTTVWRHQFFGVQPFLLSNSHIHTWPLEKP